MDQVKVFVGLRTPQVAVYVPRKLITARSGFFEKACADPGHAKNGFVGLPFASRIDFSLYLHVLHFDELGTEDEENKMGPNVVDAVRVYFLAEKLDDPLSLNVIIDALVLLFEEQRDQQQEFDVNLELLVNLVYSRAPAKSHPLKRLLVDLALKHWSFSRFSDCLETESLRMFIRDVAQAFAKTADSGGNRSDGALESKKYHVEVKKA